MGLFQVTHLCILRASGKGLRERARGFDNERNLICSEPHSVRTSIQPSVAFASVYPVLCVIVLYCMSVPQSEMTRTLKGSRRCIQFSSDMSDRCKQEVLNDFQGSSGKPSYHMTWFVPHGRGS